MLSRTHNLFCQRQDVPGSGGNGREVYPLIDIANACCVLTWHCLERTGEEQNV